MSLPMQVLTVLGFYLLIVLGPDGSGGATASLHGGSLTLAFTFTGLVVRLHHFVDAVRRAA